MNILIVSDAYYPYPSGVTEYVYHLAKKLREFGHNVKIVATSFNPVEDKKYDVLRVGKVFYLPANGSYATMPIGTEIPARMKYIIEEGDYDIIHLNGPLFPNLSFFALKYSNTITVASFLSASESNRGFGSRIFKATFGNIYKKLNVRISISEAAKRNYESYIPGKYVTIPAGVDTKSFKSVGDTIPDIPTNSILFLGRLDRRKGLDRLLHAFVYVKKNVKDVKLIIVGKGPLESYYKKMAEDIGVSNYVEFRGFAPIEDIPRYYRSSGVYTSPAKGGESFGIVLIEAMACGIPVVASNIQGYNEIVKNGKNGILVNTDNSREYAKALIQVLEDARLRRYLLRNALIDVKNIYSWNVVGKQIENLYFSLLK